MTTKDTSVSKSLSKKDESLYILQRIKLLITEFFYSILCCMRIFTDNIPELRDVFRTMSRICDGVFLRKLPLTVNYFHKKARVFIDIKQGPKCVLNLKFDNWKKTQKKHSVFADFHPVMISYSREKKVEIKFHRFPVSKFYENRPIFVILAHSIKVSSSTK